MTLKPSSLIIALAVCLPTLAIAAGQSQTAIMASVAGKCELGAAAGGGLDPSQAIVLAIDTNASHSGVGEAAISTTRSMRLLCNQPFVVNLESEQGAVRRLSTENGGEGVDTAILGGTMAKAIGYAARPKLSDLNTGLYTPTYSSLVANADLRSGLAPADRMIARNVVRTNPAGENSGGAYDGTLEINITTQSSPLLVAGSYRDTLRVILVAQ